MIKPPAETQRLAAYENMAAFGYNRLSPRDKEIIDYFTKYFVDN